MNTTLSLKKHKDKVLTHQSLPLWEGMIPLDLETEEAPAIRWKGHPIPWNLWFQALGFFRHINKEHKSEAQVRLAYNPTAPAETSWRIVVMPQRVATGMYSEELKALDDKQTEQREAALASLSTEDGVWHLNGTNHSHCDSSAFQSGTDYADEMSQTGVHLTFGRVSSDEVHVHGRVTLRGIKYPIDWKDWVPDLDWEEGASLRDDFTLTLTKDTDLSFPKEWLDLCYVIAEPKRPIHAWKGHKSKYGNEWFRSNEEKPMPKTNWATPYEPYGDAEDKEDLLSDAEAKLPASLYGLFRRYITRYYDNYWTAEGALYKLEAITNCLTDFELDGVFDMDELFSALMQDCSPPNPQQKQEEQAIKQQTALSLWKD